MWTLLRGLVDPIWKLLVDSFQKLVNRRKARAETRRLLDDSYTRYSPLIIKNLGEYQLFGTRITANVEDSFVSLTITDIAERDLYVQRDDLTMTLAHGQITDGRAPAKARTMSIVTALNECADGLALTGLAGSGKTTAMRHIAVRAAKGLKIKGHQRFPLYIQVRDIKNWDHPRSPTTIEDEIITFLEKLGTTHPERVLRELLVTGSALVLIDGIDETAPKNQATILSELQALRKRYANPESASPLFCVSGRPYSLDTQIEGFTWGEIVALEPRERREFVRRWFARIDEAKGEAFIGLFEKDVRMFSLGSRPLILSLLCALYNNDLDFPQNFTDLLERCMHGLMGGWDVDRNIARETVLRPYSIPQRIALIARLARGMFQSDMRVFTPDDVRRCLHLKLGATEISDRTFPIDAFLRSLFNDFGILIMRGNSYYAFTHLYFQEYLTARSICSESLEAELSEQMLNEGHRWNEVARALARLTSSGDRLAGTVLARLDPGKSDHLRWVISFFQSIPLVAEPLKNGIFEKILEHALVAIEDAGEARAEKDGVYVESRGDYHRERSLLRQAAEMLVTANSFGFDYRFFRIPRKLSWGIQRESSGRVSHLRLVIPELGDSNKTRIETFRVLEAG